MHINSLEPTLKPKQTEAEVLESKKLQKILEQLNSVQGTGC